MFQPVFMCFSPLGAAGGVSKWSPKGLVHNLLMQFFTLDSSKIEVFEAYFFDVVITYNDEKKYAM